MRAPFVVALMLVLACAPGDPAPPKPTTTTPPTTPTSPPTSPSTSTPPATPPSTPAAPTPTVTFANFDSSPECNGLLPDHAPEPVTISRTPPDGFLCGGGLSEGTGHVAVSAQNASGFASWQAFTPAGAPEQSFTAWTVIPEPSGWHALVVAPAASPPGGTIVSHAALGPDGAALGSEQVSIDPVQVSTTRWSAGSDPAGGSFVLLAYTDNFHNHWAALRAERFDAAAGARFAAPAQFGARSDGNVFFVAGGVSRAGESLSLWQESAFVDVSWMDGAGAEVASAQLVEHQADVFGQAGLSPSVELTPLLDGGLAVRVDGSFRSIYPHLATTHAPLPGWLAGRATWTSRFTRGNLGYALFPPAGETSPDCSQQLELRAPSGRLCGTVTLHAASAGACATGAVDQGWDGTVVQQAALGACTYRFWPKLLAR